MGVELADWAAGRADTLQAGMVGQDPASLLDVPGQRYAWPERLKQGNALLQTLFPGRIRDSDLPGMPKFDGVPLLVAPWEGATRVVLSFGGNTGFLMLPQSLLSLRDTHLIAVRDPLRCFALFGIPGLGDSYRLALGAIRQLMAAMGATDLYCTGVSAGGYPALRYALDLGAQGVLGFSAPTTLDVADDDNAPLSRYPQLTALYKRKHELDFDLDLARSYAAAPVRPSAILMYSSSHNRDAWLAHRMANLAGVTIKAVSPEAGHRVFLWLNNQNYVRDYVAEMLTLKHVVT
jgi:hypothetical protein